MDKKDVCILLGIGALATGAYSAYKQYRQEKCISKLNKRINRLGACHNNFVKFQEVCNNLAAENAEDIDDKIMELKNENEACYNHIMELELRLIEYGPNDDIDDLSADKYIKDYYDNEEAKD